MNKEEYLDDMKALAESQFKDYERHLKTHFKSKRFSEIVDLIRKIYDNPEKKRIYRDMFWGFDYTRLEVIEDDLYFDAEARDYVGEANRFFNNLCRTFKSEDGQCFLTAVSFEDIVVYFPTTRQIDTDSFSLVDDYFTRRTAFLQRHFYRHTCQRKMTFTDFWRLLKLIANDRSYYIIKVKDEELEEAYDFNKLKDENIYNFNHKLIYHFFLSLKPVEEH